MEEAKKTSQRPTGIPELDTMLGGGFPGNAAIYLAGPPGAGKSILALQWLFAGFREHGESGVYFTLTEPTVKLLKNLRPLRFFDKDAVASVDVRAKDGVGEEAARAGVHFVDLRVVMKDIGTIKKSFTRKDIEKVCETIVEYAQRCDAKRVVIDSVTALAYRMETDDLLRTFIFELGTYLGTMEANVLLIGEGGSEDRSNFGVEGFIADGVIRLSYADGEKKDRVRTLEVVKMRGINYDAHATAFRISEGGISLFPRLPRPLTYPASTERLTTGIQGFDEMTGGGYLAGSTVLVMGPSGVGKSITALHFLLAGLRQGEPGVLVSFEESRDQIFQSAGVFGWDLDEYEKKGLLTCVVSDPEDRYLDEHVSRIAEAVRKSGARRIVIDSLSAIGNDFGVDGLRDFASRISTYFKDLKATTLLTEATEGFTGSTSLSAAHVSSFVDTIIVCRYVEIQSELRRAMLVLKMRGSAHDRKLREMVMTSSGVSISTDFRGYESILSGSSRKVKDSLEDQLRVLFLEVLGPMGEKVFNEERKKGLSAERVQKLIQQLGDQGVISVQRKADFQARSSTIFKESGA